MDVLTVAVVLSLLSVSAAKPLNCEDLLQPLALNKTQISGQWIYTEARTDHHRYSDILKTLNSSLMDIELSPENGTAVIKQRHMLNGKCRNDVIHLNMTSNTIYRSYGDGSVTITALSACADCLVLSFTCVKGTEVIRSFKLYGKTRKLSPSDFNMYHNQAECLGLGEPSFKYDENQDLCPDEEKPDTEEGKDGHKH